MHSQVAAAYFLVSSCQGFESAVEKSLADCCKHLDILFSSVMTAKEMNVLNGNELLSLEL